MHLTVAYITFRREPMIEWFWKSLDRETCLDYSDMTVVVVDARHRGSALRVAANKTKSRTIVTTPKPCVWSGPHRLTKNEYFSAASARNTAICFAQDGYLAYVDDLSVLMPGWLRGVRDAMKYGYIACGAYRKVLKLEMGETAEQLSYENFPAGWDHRWSAGHQDRAVPAYPNWFYGCSVAAPVNAFLKINGWCEDSDSTGIAGEDYITGMALANTGHKIMYDRRMLTLESEERHHIDNGLLRVNKHRPTWDGIKDPDPADKGHELINRLRDCGSFPNDFTPFPDLAALRQHILGGGEFPVMKTPDRDWYDGQALSEL